MAARGARSRKIVEKQIKKEEQKHAAKGHISDLSSLPRQQTASSHSSHGRSASRNATHILQAAPQRKQAYSPSLGSIASGESLGNSEGSGPNSKKYTVKGKQTRAPRGRLGGVPTKTKNGRATPSLARDGLSNHSLKSSSSQTTLPRSRAGVATALPWKGFKVWAGPGKSQPYRGLEDDSDLWMSSGDCLIYFLEETSYDDPRPSLRVHVSTLEQANSAFLSNLIKYGELISNDDDDADSINPRESVLYNSIQPFTRFDPRSAQDDAILPAPPRLGTGSLLRNPARQRMDNSHQRSHSPASSRAISDVESTTVVDGHKSDLPEPEITHELWLKAPSHINAPHIQRRYNVATRNFIAMLYGKPLVGTDLCELLGDLQNVMETFYELNEPDQRRDTTMDIAYYLTERKLTDVRGNLRLGLRLLHWCESQPVRWDEGYTECFVHCVGMMDASTFQMAEFNELSKQSRLNLENAYSEMQIRIIDAQERLSTFDFRDMWDVPGVNPNSPEQRSFDAFRDFIYRFYTAQYGSWPPQPSQSRHGLPAQGWLTRDIARRLQDDFGAVYDYLVDRDVVFDANETRSTRKWEILSVRSSPAGFQADSPGLPLTEIFVGFDSRQRYQHLPHPYPLLPSGHSASAAKKTEEKKKGFLSKLQKKSVQVVKERDPKEHFQTSLAFNGATNINRPGLPPRLSTNKLIDALTTHEKSLSAAIAPPPPARLGRWVLIYGILQVLSTISPDVDGLRYHENVSYFLCPKLDGCPPWLSIREFEDGPRHIPWSQHRSYCFIAPERWAEDAGKATPPAYEGHHPLPGGEIITGVDVTSNFNAVGGSRFMSNRGGLHTAIAATGRNSIGVALFPDLGELKVDEEQEQHHFNNNVPRMNVEPGTGRANLKVPGGLMKPELPMRSPGRPLSPTSTSVGTPRDTWRLEGYF